MNIKIESNFRFSVASIQYSPCGELCISLSSDEISDETHYHYSANLGEGQAESSTTAFLSIAECRLFRGCTFQSRRRYTPNVSYSPFRHNTATTSLQHRYNTAI